MSAQQYLLMLQQFAVIEMERKSLISIHFDNSDVTSDDKSTGQHQSRKIRAIQVSGAVH